MSASKSDETLAELADWLGLGYGADPDQVTSEVKTLRESIDQIARLVGVHDNGGSWPPSVVVAVRSALAARAAGSINDAAEKIRADVHQERADRFALGLQQLLDADRKIENGS